MTEVHEPGFLYGVQNLYQLYKNSASCEPLCIPQSKLILVLDWDTKYRHNPWIVVINYTDWFDGSKADVVKLFNEMEERYGGKLNGMEVHSTSFVWQRDLV